MPVRHILVAADESSEGRNAIRVAMEVARRSKARVTVLTVAEGTRSETEARMQLEALRTLVRHAAGANREPLANLALAFGLPGIEIVRFAEDNEVSLIVAGRKHRSDLQRLLVGDTTDSIARRSSVPCLFIPGTDAPLEHLLIALDGTDRRLTVLAAALDFARVIGSKVHAVSVEPAYPNEIGVLPLITGRTERVARAVEEARRGGEGGTGTWEGGEPDHSGAALVVHRGEVVEAIVQEAVRSGCDVLAVGYRRGGPAGAVEAGSVARRLVHQAPCAVLTVPI
jgi:nucleotide-binding universal stress UspA family protein